MRALAFALLMLTARNVLAAGETYGRIRGTVTEKETGLLLEGATITATGAKLIGGPRVATSGKNGTYQLSELPPGPYEIEVEYSQLKTVKKRVSVRQGEALPLDLVWSPDVFEADTIDVVEERHLTRPDSTQTGTVLSFETEKRLATQRSYSDVAQQVAGVKSDRGLPAIKGATRIQNRYMVDGMDITDSVTNNFAPQVNFDSISSLEVLTGGMEAQYNAMGGVINVNTNGGSDEFKLDTSLYVNNAAFTAQNVYGSTLSTQDLLFAKAPAGPNQGYNITFNVSGPILKQKVWYGLSFEWGFRQSSIQPAPPLNVQAPPRTTHDFRPRLKMTFAPASKHRLTWSTSGDPSIDVYRNQSNSALPISEQAQTQGGGFTVLQWDYLASENVVFNVQTGYNYNHVHQQPICMFMGGSWAKFQMDPRYSERAQTCNLEAAPHRNASDGTTWYQGPPTANSQRHTFQFDPTLSLHTEKAGSHDFKLGIQARYVGQSFERHFPGGGSYSDRGTATGEAGLCDPDTGIGCVGSQRTLSPDFQSRSWGLGIGAFVQDRWKVWKRMTILPGLRADFGHTQNTIGQVTTQSFGLGPRLGFTLDLTGDQKTILSAFYGRANETLSLLVPNYADPSSTSTTERFDPTANGGQGGWVLLNTSGGTSGYQLNPRATTPHTDEITATVNREIVQDSVVSLSYTYKRTSNIWSEVEINQIWDPTGQRVIGYVNGTPQQVSLFTTLDEAYRIYHGLDLVVEARPTPNWDFYAGYTLSFLYGTGSEQVRTVGGGNPYANPRQTKFYEGWLPEDQRHQLKVRASYQFHGLSAGLNLTYSTGSPLTKQFWNPQTNSYANRRSPSGSDPGTAANDPNTWANFRLPDTLITTLRVSYDISELTGQHLIFIADLFNVFNFSTPTSIETRDLPTFGMANSGRLAPLRLQLAVRYMY